MTEFALGSCEKPQHKAGFFSLHLQPCGVVQTMVPKPGTVPNLSWKHLAALSLAGHTETLLSKLSDFTNSTLPIPATSAHFGHKLSFPLETKASRNRFHVVMRTQKSSVPNPPTGTSAPLERQVLSITALPTLEKSLTERLVQHLCLSCHQL